MEVRIVSKNFQIPDAHTLAVARANGRYEAAKKAFSMEPEAVIVEVEKSGLRGKGGGGAPCGPKWRLINPADPRPKTLFVNADESEPGTFKDRQIMEKDPHLLIEGILISCYALGANAAYIYIRGEYKWLFDRLNEAAAEAYAAGLLGENVLGSGFKVDLTIHRGAGAYICGEKTALIESLEGNRGQPRLKPKGKEPEWFYGNPAIVNNVETIASVPYIIEAGAEGYRKYGTEQSPGTLLFGLSGHVNNPGIVEAPFGVSMLEYIETVGGGVKNGKKLKAVIPGGSSCAVLTAEEAAKATLDYESLRDLRSTLGTGGMVVMDETTDMVKALKNLLEFYHHESCGQCTPCREGTGWADRIVGKILKGEGALEDLDLLLDLADGMNGKTICVFAPAVSTVIVSYVKKFRGEFLAYMNQGGQDG